MAAVTFNNLKKRFGKTEVVKSFDLHINDGEFVVLLGPSGCGKSTTLRMLAGLEDISDGEIFIADELVNDLHPMERNIAMVFQSYALYPHMSVEQNIAFGLKMTGVPKDEIAKRVKYAAEMLELTPLLQRKPKELSGGQRQRVAMGRAMVRTPEVFLFDEPLSNLDAKLRGSMRAEIKSLHDKLGTTTLYVTHDQVEAMTLADRIVILKDGYIEQVGTPKEIFEEPANKFVASFIGAPEMNMIPATLKKAANHSSLVFSDQEIALTASYAAVDQDCTLGIRPSDLYLHQRSIDSATIGSVKADVIGVELLGATYHIQCELDGARFIAEVAISDDVNADMGDKVELFFDISRIHLFDNETGKAIMPQMN
ncbi:ABC transporter ATP-binding protein [Agarivorans gilvus]|uniref:Sugar ABC transporter ATP-binding protein n=1 Tax=Agarivorans gilvus TaxID=680279 RepID=A0ABQ1I358_9ALTE|nr:sn-glycerol-3-phosphate ABC transporter ATP-binding protein UgpC [Agarivorans gilvus]GGB07755.1 sugar ABC transporter ATP-binding protein [Agarivorans gilvus]